MARACKLTSPEVFTLSLKGMSLDFGKYDKQIKKILEKDDWAEKDDVGMRGMYTKATEDGHCIFYNLENKECMLGEYKPIHCGE